MYRKESDQKSDKNIHHYSGQRYPHPDRYWHPLHGTERDWISAMGIRYSAVPAHTMEVADALNKVLSEKWGELRVGIHYTERNGIGCAIFIAHDFLCIEEIYSLIFSCVTAINHIAAHKPNDNIFIVKRRIVWD